MQLDLLAALPTPPAVVVEPAAPAAPAPRANRRRVVQIHMGDVVMNPDKARRAAQRKART
jgi:hypothetical protein